MPFEHEIERCVETDCFYNDETVCQCCGDLRNSAEGKDCPYYTPD